MGCRRGVRRGLLGLVVAALVVAATGCQEPFQGFASGAKVAVIGDSLASQPWWGGDNIRAAFVPRHRLSLSGVPATKLTDSLGRVQEYQAMAPRAVVIQLGTNDVTEATGGAMPLPTPEGEPQRYDLTKAQNPPETIDARLTQAADALGDMLDVLKTPICIVVVNVGSAPGIPWYNDAVNRWNNDFLAPMAAAHPRVRVADWSAAVAEYSAAHPSPAERMFVADLVHPVEAGQTILANLMVRETDICLMQSMATAS